MAKKKKGINAKQLVIILIIAALLAVTATELIYHYCKYRDVVQVQAYDMKLEVSNNIGFDVGNQSLNFGTAIPNASIEKYIFISSAEPALVEVILKGGLAKWISVSESNFTINSSKQLTFTAAIPGDASAGNYSGKAIILFRKTKA
jgi:hypothetical protein